MSNGIHPEQAAIELAVTRAMEQVKLVSGKPTDALDRGRLRSWGYGSLVPRQNLTNYRTREGRTVLETLRLVRDRDPDAAQAITNFLLLMGQGYRSRATTGKQDRDGNPIIDQRAQDYLSAFDARVGEEYGGGMDALIDVLNLTLVTQGAMAAELAVADDVSEIVDVHPVDPQDIVFKREPKTNRLMRGVQVGVGVKGADQAGFLELSPRQFRYVPLHPDVDSPYGRSPILAALTAIFFKVEVLEDLKAVVHNQGYPRIDVSVVRELVLNSVPGQYTHPGHEAELAAFVNAFMTQLQQQYQQLQPDDTFIHWDSVSVNYAAPAVGSLDIRSVIQILDNQIVSGLKQLPILLGRNEGATTTHATIQLRVYVLLIEALQRKTKRLIEWMHQTALQVAGYQARVTVEFDTHPVTDQVLEAQAFETNVRAWRDAIDLGLVTEDDAANALFGHTARGERRVVVPPPGDRMRRPARTRGPILRPRGQRAIGEDERASLEDTLREQTEGHFARLAADYPADLVAEQVAGMQAFDLAETQRIVAAWFEDNPGQAWSQELTELLVEHYLRVFAVVGQSALGELGITASFELRNPAMIEALETLGAQRVTGIDEETRRQLVSALVDGVEDGESVPQLGRRLRAQIDGMTRRRSELIAVTETAEASGRASVETYRRNGVEQKRWLTADDGKVTEGCRANEDTSPIAIDALFTGGGSSVQHPPRFPGCRCAISPVLDDYTAPKEPWTGG